MSDVEYGHVAPNGQVIPLHEASQKWLTVTRDSLRVRASDVVGWRLPTRAEMAAYAVQHWPEGPQHVPDPDDDGDVPDEEPRLPGPHVITRVDAIRRAAGAVFMCEHIARNAPPGPLPLDGMAVQLQAAQVWATLAVAFIDDEESYTIDLADGV